MSISSTLNPPATAGRSTGDHCGVTGKPRRGSQIVAGRGRTMLVRRLHRCGIDPLRERAAVQEAQLGGFA